MSHRKRVLLILVCLCASVPAAAQDIQVQFDGIEMRAFLEWSSKLSKRRLMYDNAGKLGSAKVHLLAPEPIPLKSVWALTRSVLAMHGFGMIEMKSNGQSVFKIVELSKISTQPVPLVEKLGTGEAGERYVTHVLSLKHVPAATVLGYLTKGKLVDTARTAVAELKEANALLISDFEPHLAKIRKVVELLDRAGPKAETHFFELAEEDASSAAEVLKKLMAADLRPRRGATSGKPLLIEAHPRTNSIIAHGTPEQMARIARYVKHLDRPRKTLQRLKYVKLQHAEAKGISALLEKVVQRPPFAKESKVAGKPVPGLSIVADENANALVITATQEQHRMLADLLAQLDRPRPQILLEVAIVEFTPASTLALGVELMNLDRPAADKTRGFVNSSFGLSALVDRTGGTIAPGAPGVTVGRLPIPGAGLNTFLLRGLGVRLPLVLRALQTRNKTNVLSLPRVLAVDGVPAELKVTDETPVVQTNALNTATSTTSFQQFVPAGTILKFTAKVSQDRTINLDIEQTVEAFVGAAAGPGVPPAKTSRFLKTSVRVPDRKIIVLGGFAVGRDVETVDQVPLLGDIPLLGLLFRSKVRSVSKTHLYIFVQPRIIDPDGMKALERRSDEIRKEKDRLVPPIDVRGENKEQK